ncbi:MAG TPA: phosphohydrolase [Lachnospiraceae bacterium]|nr:phosphohydrolase [Lachnospiraceae bacterium]
MTIAALMEKMIAFTSADSTIVHHDVNHFMKVWGFARTIGTAEQLDETAQFTLEAAAILHDIACPLCRRKYGSAPGTLQEKEGKPLAEGFFKDTDIPKAIQQRIVYIVSHHHTYTGVDGIDYQIMLEADFLVSADEGHESTQGIQTFGDKVFKTPTGIRLLHDLYGYVPRS